MFDNMFKPIKIGPLEIKNRLVRTAAYTHYGAEDSSVTPFEMRFFSELAKGGIGLAVVGITYVDEKASQAMPYEISVASDERIPGLAKMAQAIKENGARAGIQLCHIGGAKRLPPRVGPSAVPYFSVLGEQIPEELSVEDIRELVDAFAQAAARAKEAGFDLVEIHSAHEHLLGQFLTRRDNVRSDDYGGSSLQNRMRVTLEVLESVRHRVGKDFPISVKISVTDFTPDGIAVEESIELARELERRGADAINASCGGNSTLHKMIPPIYFPSGCNVYLAEMIKKVVSIPVMTLGGITSPDLVEEILATGKADMVAFARTLFADQHFPRKAKEGRVADIRPCIRCTEGCFGGILRDERITCTVNAELGMDYEQSLEKVAKPRKVAVVGAGPGGLEAAMVAAVKGHQVTLYEKRDGLGGYLIEDSMPEFKKGRRQLITYYVSQLEKLGVTVKHEEATAKTIEDGGFDVAIVATGTNREVPRLKVKGADKALVIDVVDAYQGKLKGNNVVLIASEWETGCCDLALYLAEQGKKTTMLFGGDMEEVMTEVSSVALPLDMMAIWEVMPQQGIELHYGMKVREIGDAGVVAVDKEGKKVVFSADTVVVAPKFTPNDTLAKALAKRELEVHSVGSCVEPRRFYHAIHEGHAVARQL